MVLKLGLDYKMVLDDLRPYEINNLIENQYLKNKDLYESVRLISYVLCQINTKKKLSPEDVLKFNWDDMEDNSDYQQSDEEKLSMLKDMKEELKSMGVL